MNESTQIRLPVLTTLLALLVLGGNRAMAVENADYRVAEIHGDLEIRIYTPQILAETAVVSDFDDAGSQAFQRLFSYISGANRAQSKIAMTAPVSQEAAPQKIAMTAPVVQEGSESNWRVAFLVPSSYTWSTVPQPTDERVRLRQIPARTIAALRFSGTWGEDRFRDHESKLRALIKERGLQPVGEPIFARYNPPFTPWFMRRNEVLIPIEPIE
jgi:hypothetical protein